MRLVLNMDLDNAAFEVDGRDDARDGHDIAWCLREVAQKLDGLWVGARTSCDVRDHNGNRVGTATVEA